MERANENESKQKEWFLFFSMSENVQGKKNICILSSSLIGGTFHKSKLVASATRCDRQ